MEVKQNENSLSAKDSLDRIKDQFFAKVMPITNNISYTKSKKYQIY